MAIEVGTAPDSWGVWFAEDFRQVPASRFLDEVVEAGYDRIELGPFGYLPKDLAELKKALSKRGLSVSGTFVMGHLEQPETLRMMREETAAVCALLQNLGARYVVLIDDTYTDLFTGEPTASSRLKPDEWKRLVDGANVLGRQVRDAGLVLAFHPHAETHVEYEDQIEAFLEETDPQYVQLCLDTGHHAYRGGDPVKFLHKHFSRIPYLHLKNVDRAMQEKVNAAGTPFATAVATGVFCEPSRGVVDFTALAALLRTLGYDGWITVEQDMFPVAFDKPLPIARRTRQYLREIGIG
jgi:inosose dehydratase